MAPLIAQLIKSGLTILGGTLLEKGKEVVEEKLGIELPPLDKEVSQEKLLELRQLEIDHEEKLTALRLEEKRIDLDEFKVDVSDKGSARKRDVAYLTAGKRNYRPDVMFVLAVIVICWLVWVVWKDPGINEYVKGIFTLVLGRFLGYLDNIYNFEFGSTRSSKAKDSTIEQLSKGDKS